MNLRASFNSDRISRFYALWAALTLVLAAPSSTHAAPLVDVSPTASIAATGFDQVEPGSAGAKRLDFAGSALRGSRASESLGSAGGGDSVDSSIKIAEVTSDLFAPWDTDLYAFEALAGEELHLTMTALSAGLNPYLMLYAPSGQLLAVNDDGAGFPDARIDWDAAVGGMYFVRAMSSGQQSSGVYKLRVERIAWGVLPPPSPTQPVPPPSACHVEIQQVWTEDQSGQQRSSFFGFETVRFRTLLVNSCPTQRGVVLTYRQGPCDTPLCFWQWKTKQTLGVVAQPGSSVHTYGVKLSDYGPGFFQVQTTDQSNASLGKGKLTMKFIVIPTP